MLKRQIRLAIVVAALVAWSAPSAVVRAQTPRHLALVGGMLLDGYDAPPVHRAAVLIEGNRIGQTFGRVGSGRDQAEAQNGGKKPILMSVRVSIEPTSMLAVVSLVAASIHAREKGRSDLRDLSSSGLQRFTRGMREQAMQVKLRPAGLPRQRRERQIAIQVSGRERQYRLNFPQRRGHDLDSNAEAWPAA